MGKVFVVFMLVISQWSVVSAKDAVPVVSEGDAAQIICGNKYEIRDHMGKMSQLIVSLRGMVYKILEGKNVDKIKESIVSDSQVLRTHLTAVFPKIPQKIKNIDPDNIRANKIIFQKYLLEVISYTLKLEEELLKTPTTPYEKEAQYVKIASYIVHLEETVDKAHIQFR